MSQVPTGYLLQSTSAFLSVFKVTVKKSLMGCQISAMWHHGWDPGTKIRLCCSVHSVVSNSLWLHTLQHTTLPCSSPSSRICSNSSPLSWWYHPTISPSVVPFSSLQSFPGSGSFPMCQFFTLGGQSIGASVSASVFPTNIQGWFPLGLTGMIAHAFL